MKRKSLLLSLIAIVILAACKKEEDPPYFPSEVDRLNTDLLKAFDTLNVQMSTSANTLVLLNNDSVLIRQEMAKLFTKTRHVTDVVYVNSNGVMEIIEPSAYYKDEGKDISDQDHVIQVTQTKQPAMSKSFLVEEGFYGVVVMHPLLFDNTLKGYLASVIKPEELLENYVQPLTQGKDFEIFVMEKGGRILYDVDQSKVGTNVFVDIRYMLSPEMIESAKIIDKDQKGETDYTFLEIDATEPVHKRAYWNTFSMFGTEWKLILIKEEAHVENHQAH